MFHNGTNYNSSSISHHQLQYALITYIRSWNASNRYIIMPLQLMMTFIIIHPGQYVKHLTKKLTKVLQIRQWRLCKRNLHIS